MLEYIICIIATGIISVHPIRHFTNFPVLFMALSQYNLNTNLISYCDLKKYIWFILKKLILSGHINTHIHC